MTKSSTLTESCKVLAPCFIGYQIWDIGSEFWGRSSKKENIEHSKSAFFISPHFA
jgi:hypothetical protein